MKIESFVSNIPTMGDTRTYEDFFKYIHLHPHNLGVVSRMYPDLTATHLTEALGNIFYREAGGKPKYQSLDVLMFEWAIDNNQIKRIPFAATPQGNGVGGTDIVVAFKERWYDLYDTFKIENSGQQCFVASHPRRLADNYWEYTVRLVANNYDSALDLDACKEGMLTRWISNHVPELHEFGTTKWQSNATKMRGYITTHRNDADYSSLYALEEDVFIKVSGDKKDVASNGIYKLDSVKHNLLENFLTARNNSLLFSKSNVDPTTGKPTIVDPVGNRPIYISDGLIPQAEAFASKYAFNNFTLSVLKTAMSAMSKKSKTPTGNKYTFITNERGWMLVHEVLDQYLSNYHTDGAFLWSMKANGYVKVGAEGYDTYRWMGNEVTFIVDRTFTWEFGEDKAYFLCLDLTSDKTSAQPPIALFTLKGKDIVSNIYEGVGGRSGGDDGNVASPVAGTKLILHGYSGLALFNPYRSYIMFEN